MIKTKVIINYITIKDTDGSPDPSKLISWEYEKDEETVSEATLKLPKSVNDLVGLNNGQLVEIWSGWTTSTDTRYFYGYIDNIKPSGAVLEVTCKNEMISLVRKNVNHVYDSTIDASAGEVSEIAEDLIETYGGMTASVQASGTSDGERIDQFKCINADIFERIVALKKALNWELYYNDSDRKVYFQPVGYVDSGKTITVGSTIVEMPEWEFDDSNMINDLRVDGATAQTNLTETGKIGTTAGYTTASITLDNTPDIVELYMDAGTPPTTQVTGGTKDGSSGNFYYVDNENKKVMPATGTTFTTDHYAIVNYVWSSPAPIHMKNQISIDTYGLKQTVLSLTDVSSILDAESRATNILSKRSVPFITGNLKVKSEDASIPNRGELINIVDTKTPQVNGLVLSGVYSVNKIKYMFPSSYEEIEVGDSTWRLVDWQTSTEERLKRIEEQFVRNQDIIVELVDIKNDPAVTVEPRYRKVITENIAGDTLIWGNTTFGIWGTSKWGGTANISFVLGNSLAAVLGTSLLGSQVSAEVNHFIQQFENLYTEDFVDTDFDSGGNASWGTTGSVTFTAGQVAESTSVDYNNGTITTATLTSTEVSGSFTYELTADGTNWEEVTSGEIKSFLNPGSDLRWRATESGASTGEITKLILSDYH